MILRWQRALSASLATSMPSATSARGSNNSLLITPTRPPLAVQRAGDMIEVDFDGKVVSGDAAARPIEVFLHIGIYKARADVRAICRTHAPFASVWPANGEALRNPARFRRAFPATWRPTMAATLIHTAKLGAERGESSRLRECVDPARAMACSRLAGIWERQRRGCGGWRSAAHRPGGRESNRAPFSAEDLAARSRWYPAETERIWTWLKYLGSDDAHHREPSY